MTVKHLSEFRASDNLVAVVSDHNYQVTILQGKTDAAAYRSLKPGVLVLFFFVLVFLEWEPLINPAAAIVFCVLKCAGIQ